MTALYKTVRVAPIYRHAKTWTHCFSALWRFSASFRALGNSATIETDPPSDKEFPSTGKPRHHEPRCGSMRCCMASARTALHNPVDAVFRAMKKPGPRLCRAPRWLECVDPHYRELWGRKRNSSFSNAIEDTDLRAILARRRNVGNAESIERNSPVGHSMGGFMVAIAQPTIRTSQVW